MGGQGEAVELDDDPCKRQQLEEEKDEQQCRERQDRGRPDAGQSHPVRQRQLAVGEPLDIRFDIEQVELPESAECRRDQRQGAIGEQAERDQLAQGKLDQRPVGALLFRLLTFLRPNLGWIALSVLLGFMTITSSIGLMGTSAYIISAAALQPSIAVLQVPIVGVRFFGISRGLFRYLERLVSHQTTFRVLTQLRVWFYEKLEPLAPARLQQYRSGDLLANIVSDINSLENFYIRVIAPPLIALLVALFAGFMLVGYAPQLTLALWIFLGLAGILLPWWTFRLARGVGAEILEFRAALSSALVDGIQGLPDLLAFDRGSDQLNHIRILGKKLAENQARYARLDGLQNALMNLFTNLGMWTVLVLSIPLVTS